MEIETRVEGTAVLLTRAGGLYVSLRTGCRTWNGKWQAAGGGLDDDEDPLPSAKREVFEETGLSIPLERFVYLGSSAETTPQGTTMRVHYYRVELETGEQPENLEPDKHGDWEWVPKDEILERDVLDGLKSDVVRTKYLEVRG